MKGTFIPLAATLLMIGGCIGLGAGLLTLLGLCTKLKRFEAAVWSFVIGLGLLGWLTFFVGISGAINASVFLILLIPSLGGVVLLRRAAPSESVVEQRDIVWLLLLLALGILIAIDALEAYSPPVDADSLAYHFALPKQFLAAGKIFFVPRAIDGAVPLLIQTTYMIALALGGEVAMTLWAAAIGWALGLLTFVAARPYMSRNWAMCAAIIVLSTPAVLYSGGTGQVETRLALFATLGALAMMRGISSRDLGFVCLAGVLAGFCLGTKFTGTLLAAAGFLPLLIWWRSPKAIFLFGAAAILMGSQWYIWNWWHTGDPIFPALFSLIGLPDSDFWTAQQDAIFRDVYFAAERPLPRTILWLIGYPFWATFTPSAAIESGRTGLGPYGLLVAPFAFAGAWHWRHRLASHPLTILIVVALAFYVLWFVIGMSQRVRHLLPMWPVLVVCLTSTAVNWTRVSSLRRPLVMGTACVIAIHLGGQMIFGQSYLQYKFTGESRSDFLRRSVSEYDFVEPVQAMMGPSDRVLIGMRQLIYFFDRPVFYFHEFDQSQVVIRDAADDPMRLLRSMRTQNITLVLVPMGANTEDPPSQLSVAMNSLAKRGCAEFVQSITADVINSRTLRIRPNKVEAMLYRLSTPECSDL